MTGYGRGACESEGLLATVEIRSVNHRFLDLKLRGAALAPEVEEAITGAVRQRVERGTVTVLVRVEQHGEAAALLIDREVARRVHAELSAMRAELDIDGPVSLALICAQPGVLVPRQDETGREHMASCVLEAASRALDAMIRMREAEGTALARDLEGRLSRLSELVDELAELAQREPAQAKQRLEERLGRLLEGSEIVVEADRLAQEVALLADRLDITEELVRLRSHLEHAGFLGSEIPNAVGRRLEFLVQEMGREINTIGAKSHSGDIARLVVDAKAELEKIREQVQNVE